MNEFKRKLEALCDIAEWNPSEAELKRLKNEILELSKKKKVEVRDIQALVCKHFPDTTYFLLSGVDTRDVDTMLTLLLKQAKNEND